MSLQLHMNIPLDLRTPTGFGASLRNSTPKSMGISKAPGGLYFCRYTGAGHLVNPLLTHLTKIPVKFDVPR